MEVFVGFLRAHFRYASRDPDLPFQRLPEEHQRGVRILLQFAALAAFVIRVEDKAIFIEAFEQDHSRRRFTIASGGGQRRRIRLLQPRAHGRVEPFLEQPDGI